MLNEFGLQDTGVDIFSQPYGTFIPWKDEWSTWDANKYLELMRKFSATLNKEPTMNWNKPFETKSGLKARLLGVLKTNNTGSHRNIVATTESSGNETTRHYNDAGLYFGPSQASGLDLINTPTEVSTREAFAHVYELADGTHRLGSFVYATKQEAIDGRKALQDSWFIDGHNKPAIYKEPGKHLGVTKLNTRVKIEE